MKIQITFFLFLILAFFGSGEAQGQETPVDTFKTFTVQEGDTSFVLKQYFLCFLKRGPVRDQPEEEATRIQEQHLAHLNSLAEQKKICIVGPMGDDGEIRGVTIFNVTTLEEAERLANNDPAVKAGRLVTEIHPWWSAVGSKLF
ncbi:MAG: hypothetical protein HKN16_11095 [Saprospiraceae bacterium]|nr:hypothetical protein [Saprospiraceae bacterium]